VSTAFSSAPVGNEGGGDARLVLHHAIRYLPTRVVPTLLGLVSAPILTRSFGEAGYGHYTLLVLIAGYASVVFGEWVTAGYQRFVLSADPGERRAAEEAPAWSALVLAGGSLLALSLAFVGGVTLLDLAAVVVMTWGLTVFQLVITRFVMAERSMAATVLQVVVSSGRFLIVVWIALSDKSPAVLVLVTGCTVVVVCTAFLYDRRHPFRRPRAVSLARLLSFGGFMVVTSIALNGLSTIDRFLLARLTSEAVVGRYSAAYTLSEQAVLLLPSVLLLAITPRVTALWEANRRREAGKLSTDIALLHLELCIPVVVTLAIFGEEITRAAFGAGFAERTIPGLVAIGACFLAVSTYANLGLRMARRAGRQALQAIAALVVNVALVLILVPWWGAEGAALATVVGYLTVAAWSVIDNQHFIDVKRLMTGVTTIAIPALGLFAADGVIQGGAPLGAALVIYGAVAGLRGWRRLRLAWAGGL
jgi:O-antigen/teichoic acid export membrane protein